MNVQSILQRFVESAKGTIQRFPFTIAFLIAFTIQIITYIFLKKEPDALTFFLSVGMLVTLLFHVCTEEKPQLSNAKKYGILGSAIALLAVDSIALHYTEKLSVAVGVAQGSAILALVVALCFLPFYKEKDDRKSWNFVFNLLLGGAIAYVVGGIMTGGLEFLYYGSCELFGMKSNEKIAQVIAALCLVTLPVLLFLIRIPEGEEKHNRRLPRNRFVLGIARYLFLPLALLYMIVLYAYGAKILFTWTLPQGLLSGLVSTLMFGIIGLSFLLYPYLNDAEHKGFEKPIMRWIPLAAIPLIFLMSIGIGRRLMDYGITANRLYVLTLNVWFYIVALGLFFNRARRIHWISISFALILIATSCHPFNFIKVSRNIIFNRLERVLAEYPLEKKSMTTDQLKKHFRSIPVDVARKQFNALKDGKDTDWEHFNELYGKDWPYLWGTYDDFMGIKSKEEQERLRNSFNMDYDYSQNISIPEGYKYVKWITLYETITTANIKDKKGDEIYGHMLNAKDFSLYVPEFGFVKVQHSKLKNKQSYAFKFDNCEATFTPLNLSLSLNSDSTYWCKLEGYVFYN